MKSCITIYYDGSLGRKVVYDNDHFWVYSMSEKNYNYYLNSNSYAKLKKFGIENLFDVCQLSKIPYIKKFIGKIKHDKENSVVSILFFVKEPNTYILIGSGAEKQNQKGILKPPSMDTSGVLIFKTKNNDKIIKLESPEGTFANPMNYAVGKLYTYLFLGNTYIDNNELKKDENPYQHLYMYSKYQKHIRNALNQKEIQKIVEEYKKTHKIY